MNVTEGVSQTVFGCSLAVAAALPGSATATGSVSAPALIVCTGTRAAGSSGEWMDLELSNLCATLHAVQLSTGAHHADSSEIWFASEGVYESQPDEVRRLEVDCSPNAFAVDVSDFHVWGE